MFKGLSQNSVWLISSKTYPESFRVIAQKNVGEDIFLDSIFRTPIENHSYARQLHISTDL